MHEIGYPYQRTWGENHCHHQFDSFHKLAEKKDAKKKCTTAKAKFTRHLNSLITSEQSNAPVRVLKDLYSELQKAYTNLEDKNDHYIELMDEDDDEDKKNADEATAYFDEVHKKYLAIKIIIIDQLSESTDQRESAEQQPKNNEANVRVKKLDAPSFSVNSRNNPSLNENLKRIWYLHLGRIAALP